MTQKKSQEGEFTTEIGGKKLTITTGKLAQQATGSCVAQYGETVVLATAVMSETIKEDVDYFPLMVDYEEKLYAAGKIKSSRFIKREGRASEEAILTARLIDRAIRPLFPDDLRNEVQVILTVLSVDQENDPDVAALLAASAALAISGIPWAGPVGGLRIGRINDEWVLNPSYEARQKSVLDMVVAGINDRLLMLEASAKELPDDLAEPAVAFGLKHIKKVIALIEEVKKQVGQPKIIIEKKTEDSAEEAAEKEKITKLTKDFLKEKLPEYLFSGEPKETKIARKRSLERIKDGLIEYLKDKQVGKDKREAALKDFSKYVEAEVTKAILEKGRRVDGRKLDEIRPLSCEVGLLPRTHGSALFARGDTQVLSTVTLGSPSDEQIIEGMEVSGRKRFMHHYYFPPYSVGECKPIRGVGRREIGHGALAERALIPVLPDKEKFLYTIRVVSETLSSNGSSSMASTCGSSLALMDAGVPIKKAVAGIAMGLASDESGNYKILTDIQDLEDGKGGMDFKVAGTKDGITAIQLDTKTLGLSKEIVKETFKRAKKARLEILKVMEQAIAKPRPELSPYAPRLASLKVDPEKIREIIGPGGRVINAIIESTGATIDVEPDGLVLVYCVNSKGLEKAVQWIKDIVREPEVGEIFTGKVTRITDFGAFVEILPGKEGLVHISEIDWSHVNKVEDYLRVGDEVKVKVIEIDDQNRVNLSIKALREKPAGYQERLSHNQRIFNHGSRDKHHNNYYNNNRTSNRRKKFSDRPKSRNRF